MCAIRDRSFFKVEKGFLVRKKVALRMLQNKLVTEEQMDNLLRLTAPLHDFRDKDQHKENPSHPPVVTLIMDGTRYAICTAAVDKAEYIDPSEISALYELLKSLEPTIGRLEFLKKSD